MASDLIRCGWVSGSDLYQAYHDTEWGVPQRDSRKLFEMLILEGFQAGLSWLTILQKRENFRTAFAGFDPDILATWGEADVERLAQDPGIVRHRGKIRAAIDGARAWHRLEEGEGFSPFIWAHVGGRPVQNPVKTMSDVPAKTEISEALSKALKKAGFKFCGPTITYAFMQAAGLVNDHAADCHRRAPVAALG